MLCYLNLIENFADLFYFSHEGMTDLIAIMSTLVDDQGRILINGIYDDVAPLSPAEEQLYNKITFDVVR